MPAVHTVQQPSYRLRIEYDEEPLNPRVDYDNFGHMACWHSRYNLGDQHAFGEPVELLKQMIRDTLSADEVIDYVKKANLSELRLIYNRSEHEWQLQDEYNGQWFTEYTFPPKTLKSSDMAKECVMELLPFNSLEELAGRQNVILPLYLYEHSGITMSCDYAYPYNDRWDAGQVGWIYASYEEIEKEYGAVNQEALEKAKNLLRGEVQIYDHYLCGECYGYIIEENGKETDSLWGFFGDLRDVLEDMKSNAAEEHQHLFDHVDYCVMEYSENMESDSEDLEL